MSNTFYACSLLLAAWALLPNKNPYQIAGPALRPRSYFPADLDMEFPFTPGPQLFIWDYI